MSGVPICERLGRLADNIDDLGIPTRDGATLREAADTIEALVEALEGLAMAAGTLVVRTDGKFRPERSAALDAMVLAETALSRARNGGQP